MKHYSILFILFLGLSLQAQQELKGTIVADSISFTQVNIVNLNKELGTVNNTKGKFTIVAEAGDEIVFSSVQFEPYQIQVTQEMLKQDQTIYLFPAVNELEEVKLSNINLSGDLTKDASNLKVKPYFNPSQVGLPNPLPKLTVEDRRLYTAQSGGPAGVLADVISGRMAMLKRMKEIAEYEALVHKAKRLVSLSFVEEDLNIPQDYIDDFFYFCTKDEKFEAVVKRAGKLEMIEFLTQKKGEYFIYKEWE
ncbi:carboxypeptidase-like regulatory domain-containing protein [Mesonia aestuariivivens]|uniref:Carboxypeptidase-like regulatory domain-containing protein n=1 Tax=Mesonia aestuariivivens TaxID=2796128 RepID=A0ABS6VZA1_9FLAO|nr:carboxypeptidase-like regulatory domain-containing protein [Mesonia aestuariivivens]MBW2960921.1 carboxypeptidase-like regulatory domain-containing protein [Mesonia aestuariivivens]